MQGYRKSPNTHLPHKFGDNILHKNMTKTFHVQLEKITVFHPCHKLIQDDNGNPYTNMVRDFKKKLMLIVPFCRKSLNQHKENATASQPTKKPQSISYNAKHLNNYFQFSYFIVIISYYISMYIFVGYLITSNNDV